MLPRMHRICLVCKALALPDFQSRFRVITCNHGQGVLCERSESLANCALVTYATKTRDKGHKCGLTIIRAVRVQTNFSLGLLLSSNANFGERLYA